MKAYFILLSLALVYTLASFTYPGQEHHYSIVGSWKLTAIQFNADERTAQQEEQVNNSLSQSKTRFVYESTGQFKLVLSDDGRGLQGGYHYDPQNHILSIKYGSHTDTALVSWVNKNKMIHMTKDGKTKTVLERE
ncbi:hypothetical protein [uncultured Pontibacter sp.]|uniref:hypothetical protein n=1 Tax=uncultured Pontibacter sp. TaxID=453356 RepID=UPI0026174ACA|nr:hypothetical protein [uncultured Pontibacter sp.]